VAAKENETRKKWGRGWQLISDPGPVQRSGKDTRTGDVCIFLERSTHVNFDFFLLLLSCRFVLLLLLSCCSCCWQALRRASLYRVPLYVTETGISIASERERRYTIDSYMKEVSGNCSTCQVSLTHF
jgi:hypothetical protein